MAQFRDTVPVLLSTESAGEGRNLQFCHVMINVDLPWNPMQIEQRVGRLHRVGQVNDVLVTNLVARGTIEQQILSVLEAKINLFELVVGELDMILGPVDDDFDFETSVFDAFVAAQDDADFRRPTRGSRRPGWPTPGATTSVPAAGWTSWSGESSPHDGRGSRVSTSGCGTWRRGRPARAGRRLDPGAAAGNPAGQARAGRRT